MSGKDSQVEIESKVELSEQDYEHLLARGIVHRCIHQLNVYYDSDDRLSREAITLRVRYSLQEKPRLTLKIPTARDEEQRQALEIEADYGNWLPSRVVRVEGELPSAFHSFLLARGINSLRRVGWMRTVRQEVQLPTGGKVELDRVSLPGGAMFFEAEIEDAQADGHRRTVQALIDMIGVIKPSMRSKYERFLQASRPLPPEAPRHPQAV